MRYLKINFDGIVGPTHNYAGLSLGNVASVKHKGDASHPRAAALQGLEKAKTGALPPYCVWLANAVTLCVGAWLYRDAIRR